MTGRHIGRCFWWLTMTVDNAVNVGRRVTKTRENGNHQRDGHWSSVVAAFSRLTLLERTAITTVA